MKRILTPILRISLSLTALTVSLILTAQALGFLPASDTSDLKVRAKVAEALAVQLSLAAGKDDLNNVRQTIEKVVARSDTILSIALRKADGQLVAQSGNHEVHWALAKDNASTPTHIRVPILNGSAVWGGIELAFAPIEQPGHLWGLPMHMWMLLGFLALGGMFGYYIILRRALREIDTSKAVPPRVQAAFNSLSEGVLVVDENESILLANAAIADAIGSTPDALFSSSVSDLAWRQWAIDDADHQLFPWRTAIKSGSPVADVSMSVRSPAGEIQTFSVNAAPIADPGGRIHGAIITFDDVTDLQRKNEQLHQANRQLKLVQTEVLRQNKELQYLATRDPLSGCLNRRSLFSEFETCLENARQTGGSLAVIMVDIDHFKSINDNFGHAVGDEVIASVGEVLRSCCRDEDLVARYGGEEFCVVLVGLAKDASAQAAQRIRLELKTRSKTWLNSDRLVTASLGCSFFTQADTTAMDLVNEADMALYKAKRSGRDRVVFYDDLSCDEVEKATGVGENKPLSASPSNEPHAQRVEETPQLDANAVIPHSRSEYPQQFAELSAALPDAQTFLPRLQHSIARAERNSTNIAVLHVTITSYDRHVEAFGQADVDALIRQAHERISRALRASDMIALCNQGAGLPTVTSISGAQFAIEIPDLSSSDPLVWIVKRLRDMVRGSYEFKGQQTIMSFSMGVSVYPRDGEDAVTLLSNARTADNHCRETTSIDGFLFYSREMNDQSRRKLQIQTAIQLAIESESFSLVYQPILDVNTNRTSGAEALLRIDDGALRDVPLDEIISVAEQTGQIVQIGEQITVLAIKQYQAWERLGLTLPKLSINISPIQLLQPDAIERLITIFEDAEFPTHKLQVELTETALINDLKQLQERLLRLQRLGVQIALDDFGTGHSSLSHLRVLQPDVLKIDRSFVSRIEGSQTDATLVSATIAMCHQLGIMVVAEGIESTAQLSLLRRLNCDDYQGYLASKPITPSQMTGWLRKQDERLQLQVA